ncbi:cytoskeleton protein RodZ [Marinospirillum celere]|uniref:Cytoskeleton protein RodZ n=1 Tax=Marinospirillum celere TaxID=1122252 RepID=A0A1I1IYW4_9GAMM|nr:RodZ domain-containing protein [Marinospirillum celere]SFC41436.1 cytoskeleton protein RodZ [Marinospirillum celere]
MTATQQDEKPNTENTQDKPQPSCSRPGELLRKAREAKGLTQGEVAKQLNFLPVYVPALEDENFDALHSKTFIKGYMRAYARFLKIDADEVLRCFAEHHPSLESQERVQPIEGVKPPKSGRNLVFKLFTLLVVAALIAVIILWWQSRNLEPLQSLTNQDVQVDTLDGETITAPMGQAEEERLPETTTETTSDELPQPVSELVSEEEPRQLAAQPESLPDNLETLAAETIQPPPPPAIQEFSGDPLDVTADNSNLVAMTFSDDCWTEVRDAQDRVLHANLNRAGDRILLEGEAPFRIVFGQGRAVEVFHQGEAVDFSSRIRANGYTSMTIE